MYGKFHILTKKFNLSLSQGLIGKFIPPSLERLFSSSSSDEYNTHISTIPPELLDRIIDYLHDNIQALLALGLASKQTLVRSRLHLFATLEFNDNDRKFDTFLGLLEGPWTSFTYAVEDLNLNKLFPGRLSKFKYHSTRNIPRTTANLPNLKTLRLTSIKWIHIPPHIRSFFFKLDIIDFQLDSVEVMTYQQIDLVEIFSRLPGSVQSLTLYNLQFDDTEPIPDLSLHSSTFRRPIHFKLLDSSSLLLLKDVWDPMGTDDLDVTVDSFHLRLAQMTRANRDTYTPFISRFLQRVGPSLHHLFIKLSDPYFHSSSLPYYASVDLSHCTNVRIVHVGTITLDRLFHAGEEMNPMLSVMWASLANLASHSSTLEEIVLIVRPFGETPALSAAELESFAWEALVERLHGMFPHLRTVVVGVGYYVVDGEDCAPFFEALRRAPGVRQLEEKGSVVLQMIPWNTYGSPDPAWQENTSSIQRN